MSLHSVPQCPRHAPRRAGGASRPNRQWFGRAIAAGLVCTAGYLGACRSAQAGPEAVAKRMIDNVMERYAQAYRSNDPDAMAELYTPGALLLPPGHELVTGRDSVRAFWSRGMEPGFRMVTMAVDVSGRTGYVVGRYYVPPDDQDDAETGKYIIALRRDRDGAWRITADIWNADDSDDEADSTADSTNQAVALLGQALETIAQSP